VARPVRELVTLKFWQSRLLNEGSETRRNSDCAREAEMTATCCSPLETSARKRVPVGCDNEELKGWAGKTLPTLQHHLQMAQELNKYRKK
jgi:hypothetical protein